MMASTRAALAHVVLLGAAVVVAAPLGFAPTATALAAAAGLALAASPPSMRRRVAPLTVGLALVGVLASAPLVAALL